jgi:hypothetical protein
MFGAFLTLNVSQRMTTCKLPTQDKEGKAEGDVSQISSLMFSTTTHPWMPLRPVVCKFGFLDLASPSPRLLFHRTMLCLHLENQGWAGVGSIVRANCQLTRTTWSSAANPFGLHHAAGWSRCPATRNYFNNSQSDPYVPYLVFR